MTTRRAGKADLVHFASAAAWRRWLAANHARASEIVLQLMRKHATHQGLGYAQALDEALCYGWIDGVRHAYDADSFTTRFTPRRPRSIWSNFKLTKRRRRFSPASRQAIDVPVHTGS